MNKSQIDTQIGSSSERVSGETRAESEKIYDEFGEEKKSFILQLKDYLQKPENQSFQSSMSDDEVLNIVDHQILLIQECYKSTQKHGIVLREKLRNVTDKKEVRRLIDEYKAQYKKTSKTY